MACWVLGDGCWVLGAGCQARWHAGMAWHGRWVAVVCSRITPSSTLVWFLACWRYLGCESVSGLGGAWLAWIDWDCQVGSSALPVWEILELPGCQAARLAPTPCNVCSAQFLFPDCGLAGEGKRLAPRCNSCLLLMNSMDDG